MPRWKVTRYKAGDPTPYTEEGRAELRRRAELDEAAAKELRRQQRAASKKSPPSPAETERILRGKPLPKSPAAIALPPEPAPAPGLPGRLKAAATHPAPVQPTPVQPTPVRREAPQAAAPSSGTHAAAPGPSQIGASQEAGTGRRRVAPIQDVGSLSEIDGLGALEDELIPSRAAQDVSTRLAERRAAVAARSAQARREARGGPDDPMLSDEGIRKIAESSWDRPDQRIVVCRPDRWPEFIHIPLMKFGQGSAGARRHLSPWRPERPEPEGPVLELPRANPEQILASANSEHHALADWAEAGGVVLVWCRDSPQGAALSWAHNDYRNSWGLAIEERNRIVAVLRARQAQRKAASAATLAGPPPNAGHTERQQEASRLDELPSIDLSPTREDAPEADGAPKAPRAGGRSKKSRKKAGPERAAEE